MPFYRCRYLGRRSSNRPSAWKAAALLRSLAGLLVAVLIGLLHVHPYLVGPLVVGILL